MKTAKPKAAVDLLTPRERELAKWLVLEATDKELAAKAGCSQRTIAVHLAAMRAKLNVKSRTGIVLAYIGYLPR